MSMLFRVSRVLHALPCPSCPSVPFRASRVFPVHVHVFILAPEPRPALDAPSIPRRHIFILAPSGLSLYTMSFVLFRVLLVSFVFFSCPCAFGASRVFSCLPCSIPSRWDVSLTYCRPSARLVTLTLATFTLHPKRAPDPSSAANALKVDYLVCTVLSSRQVQRCGNSMHLGGPCRGYLSPWVSWVHPHLVQQAGSQLVHVSTS